MPCMGDMGVYDLPNRDGNVGRWVDGQVMSEFMTFLTGMETYHVLTSLNL